MDPRDVLEFAAKHPDLIKEAISVLEAVFTKLFNVREGKLDPERARTDLAELRKGLAANDAAADAALDAKFPGQ